MSFSDTNLHSTAHLPGQPCSCSDRPEASADAAERKEQSRARLSKLIHIAAPIFVQEGCAGMAVIKEDLDSNAGFTIRHPSSLHGVKLICRSFKIRFLGSASSAASFHVVLFCIITNLKAVPFVESSCAIKVSSSSTISGRSQKTQGGHRRPQTDRIDVACVRIAFYSRP